MTCEIHAAGDIELYFYGELSSDQRAAMQAHVNQCVTCRQALEDLSIIRAALASRPDIATPPGGDWSRFMARLNTSVQSQPSDVPPPGGLQKEARVLHMSLPRRIAPYMAMAALLALVTTAVLTVLRREEGRPASVDVVTYSAGQSRPQLARPTVQPDAALIGSSGAHFERSKLVVLGLATRDAGKPRAEEWSRERELAATLLNDTRLYRVAAEERGMNTLAGVMRDLELVLLQTSMSEEPDLASIEQLQRLIRRRDLLTKMDMVSTNGP